MVSVKAALAGRWMRSLAFFQEREGYWSKRSRPFWATDIKPRRPQVRTPILIDTQLGRERPETSVAFPFIAPGIAL
jgi:hypothetical protein